MEQKMIKVLIAIIVGIMLLVAVVWGVSLMQNSGSTTPGGSQSVSSDSDTVQVSIKNMSFPAEIKIKAGQTVVWTNNDFSLHTVSFTNADINSGNMAIGKTFSHKFDTAGTFNYFCKTHGTSMSGKVIVE